MTIRIQRQIELYGRMNFIFQGNCYSIRLFFVLHGQFWNDPNSSATKIEFTRYYWIDSPVKFNFPFEYDDFLIIIIFLTLFSDLIFIPQFHSDSLLPFPTTIEFPPWWYVMIRLSITCVQSRLFHYSVKPISICTHSTKF